MHTQTLNKNNPQKNRDCVNDLKTNNYIRLEQVTKTFESAAGSFDALKGIDLSIGQGEYVAIVGKSGSGKSTLLNMLTGIDHPTQGAVNINSTLVHSLTETQLAKWRGKNIGIVFQFFQLIPTLTILENLLLVMDFVNAIPSESREKRAESLLAQVDISEHSAKLPSALSGGEQQRAAIARALANNPPILVADEPTGNLDSKTSDAIQRVFVQLVEKGKTVIVVTHEDVSGQDYHRIIRLYDGFVISDIKKEQKKREIL